MTKPLDEQIRDSLFSLLREYDVGGEWIGQHQGQDVSLEYTDDDHVIATLEVNDDNPDLDTELIVGRFAVQIVIKAVDVQ